MAIAACEITVINNTGNSRDLRRTYYVASPGVWDPEPATTIPASESDKFVLQPVDAQSMGEVSYRGASGGMCTIFFDCPRNEGSKNTCTITSRMGHVRYNETGHPLVATFIITGRALEEGETEEAEE